MLKRLWLFLGAVALAVVGAGTIALTAVSAGRAKEKARSMQKAIKDAQESNRTRQRLAVDPEYRKSLRRKRTRR